MRQKGTNMIASQEKEISRGLSREQPQHFSPFVRLLALSPSMDWGLLGKEAKILLKKFSALLTAKNCSEVCGCVNARMSIAIVRATHLCLGGSRTIPTSKMSKRPHPSSVLCWEDKAGSERFRAVPRISPSVIQQSCITA
jgi:hypothetical protein